jgi:hypothetical protein
MNMSEMKVGDMSLKFDRVGKEEIDWFKKLVHCIMTKPSYDRTPCETYSDVDIDRLNAIINDNKIIWNYPADKQIAPLGLKNWLKTIGIPSTLQFIEAHWSVHGQDRDYWGEIIVERIADGYVLGYEYTDCWGLEYDCLDSKGIHVIKTPSRQIIIMHPEDYKFPKYAKQPAEGLLFMPEGLFTLSKVE